MELVERAKKVLDRNWKGSFTIPTNELYPFQWMWDSGFVAMGISNYDLDKALKEIESIFSGQWENGMLPHILFHSENEKTYFPNFDFWNSSVNKGAPNKPKSSGITQPPVFGFVLEEIYKRYSDNQVVNNFIRKLIPKLIHYHRFLYDYRDPFNEGLFFIFHPWESGRDNSPIWDDALSKIELTESEIPSYERRDLKVSDEDHRPTKYQYDRYVYLLELGKKYNYEGQGIVEESPLLIQDCMMNAILIKSNESLIYLSQEFGLPTKELEAWQSLSMSNFDKKFWSEKQASYVSYDLRHDKQIEIKDIGGLIPLFAGVADAPKAKILIDYLKGLHNRGYYLCPSFDVDSELYDSKRYWRGPIWPQMNWMIYKGLKRYEELELADIVKNDLIELVQKYDFYEYFEPQKSINGENVTGYGGDNFSWTASTIIDLLLNEE